MGRRREIPMSQKGYSFTDIRDILWTDRRIFPRKVLRAQGCENVMRVCEKSKVSVSL